MERENVTWVRRESRNAAEVGRPKERERERGRAAMFAPESASARSVIPAPCPAYEADPPPSLDPSSADPALAAPDTPHEYLQGRSMA